MTRLRLLGMSTLIAALIVAGLSGSGLLALRPTQAAPSYEDLAVLTHALDLVQEHYVRDVEERELIDGALKGMLDTLDPHTSYLSKELYQEVQRDTKGEFEGLGIEITHRDGYVTVMAPIDDSPAAAAGLRAKDQIVAVCPEVTEESCLSTADMNLMEAVKLMRGPRGTEILIQVLREGWDSPRPFVIKRESIRVSSVQWHVYDGDIPYIRLSQFQERTAIDMRIALAEAHERVPEFRGLVLDLRNNPGGLLEQAVRVADLFLEEGLVVYSQGRDDGERMEWRASEPGTEPDYPMVVLVNAGSASAAEIVAGALQDHKRSLLLGDRTFGKGSVQTIIPLVDGSGLRLTTALYYLPTGRSIQADHIRPDIEVRPFSEDELERIEAQDGDASFGERNLEGHLESGEAERPPSPAGSFDERRARDRPLQRALDLLKTWSIFSRLDLGGEVAAPAGEADWRADRRGDVGPSERNSARE